MLARVLGRCRLRIDDAPTQFVILAARGVVQQRETQIRGDNFGQKRHQHLHVDDRMAHDGTSQDVEQLRMLRMQGRTDVRLCERALRIRAIVGQSLKPDAVDSQAGPERDEFGDLPIVFFLNDEVDLKAPERSRAPHLRYQIEVLDKDRPLSRTS